MARSKKKNTPLIDRSDLPIDVIIRVSRTAGRDVESERYHTEPYQREEATKAIIERGFTVGEIHTERDVSGSGKNFENRDVLKTVMERFENGEIAGVAVAYLSRFARTAGQTILTVNKIAEAGGTFITADGKFDTTTKEGKAFIGFMAVLAEMELDRITENWGSVVARAIAQDRYVAGAVPTGYCMGNDGRLVPNPDVAPKIRELFRLRAEESYSWTMLADWLTDQGVRPNTADMTEAKSTSRPARAARYGEDGWKRWSRNSIRSIIANPAYKGWARQGKIENRSAHEPIVSDALWEAAQAAELVDQRTGEMSNRCLLKSLVFCAGCGHRLVITGRFSSKAGERVPIYYCKGRYATGDCPATASVDAGKLDAYVVRLFFEHVAEWTAARQVDARNSERLAELESELTDAAREYDYWLNADADLREAVGEADWKERLAHCRRARDQAKTLLEQEERRQEAASQFETGELETIWPTLTVFEKREILSSVLDRVVLKTAGGKKGRGAPPIEARVDRIAWADERSGDPAPLTAAA